MLEFSNVLQERRVTEKDTVKWKGYTDFEIEKCRKTFEYVKAGDCIVKFSARYSHDKIDICAEVDGYVRYHDDFNTKKLGNVLFYIVDSDDLKTENWDVSEMRIDKEIIDGKYYYSLVGIPKEPVIDLGCVRCRIKIVGDDPVWKIESTVFNPYYGPDSNTMTVQRVTQEEPFRVKLKEGNHLYGSTYTRTFQKEWEEAGDGKYLKIKYFAVGYPKKSQIPKEVLRVSESVQPGEDACFVYVMRNNQNGAYKIGISKDPEYREHTLQSQEPDVTCIFQLEFPNRESARSVERDMHIKYGEYRLRGEWFSIPKEMIHGVMLDIIMLGKK